MARGASTAWTNNMGETLLHVAASRGQTAVCGYLCSRGAAVEAKDASGATPLHKACAGEFVETLRSGAGLGRA
jgi:ankyrin repeat protein